MAPPPKSKSNLELLSELDARQICENNQKNCIYYLKPRSNKNKFECKNCGCTDFYVLDHQNFSFKILSSL